MSRALIVIAASTLFAPQATSAQQPSRWFWDVGLGWSSPIEARSAFNGGGSLHLGIGRRLDHDLALTFAYARERLPYDDARFGALFDTPGEPDAEPLGANVHRLAAGLEWSPNDLGRLTPLLGASLAYEHRGVSGFVTSSAWYYCSTGTIFSYSTDPDTGVTTLTTENPTPAPGCDDLRRDIDVEGGSVTMATSLGFMVDMGPGALGFLVQYSHGFTDTLPGLLSSHLVWRAPF
jgi:hypothetical protein